MTTETMRDPVIEAWSDGLEEELVEGRMDKLQARAYRRAFELGLTRVISQTATRQELQEGLTQGRGEIGDLRREMGEMREQLQREMDQRFGELQKRLKLLSWTIGLGLAGMFG